MVVIRTDVGEEEAPSEELLHTGLVTAGAKIESIRLARAGSSPLISCSSCRSVGVRRSEFSSAGTWRRLLGTHVVAAAEPSSAETTANSIEQRMMFDNVA